ncbi:MAG: LysR family transcriptional regulator [Gammaproteobacteria bacterium]|uniref:LysR family transcriptional regulator n=1 Tax=Pseudomaricurvus alcaniphilus TaxID=1166482 RepID=UPI00140D6D82|nr:LysR family transcriptional regulator [Pseudomaricurvus alcaniphilus]MBR9912459.1 LysR family transcriptional regulator [Gammaproteobacteria bacterium]NHN37401.1 LysR family transcriptional regulator [Pseudomaricurvus alcaniphilus]
MRLDKIDLNLFVVFDAIYKERSVTKVALLLNLTQPAVSNALSRLRQTFDDPLFVRTPGGMAPTPVAESIASDVRQALALLQRSVGANARFDPATSDKVFRLSMMGLAESLLLPRILEKIKPLAPAVSITSYYSERESAAEELKAGAIDLLLDAPLVNAKELGGCHLAQLPYVVAMRQGHPLAGRPLQVADYLAAEHVHVSSRRKGRGQMDIALHKLGYNRRVVMRVQNYLVAARIVAETDLLWTVPKVLVDSLPLQSSALPFAAEMLYWNLFWHKGADNDPSIQWMKGVIEAVVEELVG